MGKTQQPLNPNTAAVAVHGARVYTTAGPMSGMVPGNGGWGNTVHQHLSCFAATSGLVLDDQPQSTPAHILVRVQALIAQASAYVGRWAHVYQPSAGQTGMVCTICGESLYDEEDLW